MNKDKLSAILDKIEDKSEVLGGVYGLVQYPLHEGIGLFVPKVTSCLQNWKPVDPLTVINAMVADPLTWGQVTNNIMTGIGGWILAEAGGIVDPRLAKLGRIAKKIGINATIGNIVGGFLWRPAFLNNPGSSPPANAPATNGYTY